MILNTKGETLNNTGDKSLSSASKSTSMKGHSDKNNTDSKKTQITVVHGRKNVVEANSVPNLNSDSFHMNLI